MLINLKERSDAYDVAPRTVNRKTIDSDYEKGLSIIGDTKNTYLYVIEI